MKWLYLFLVLLLGVMFGLQAQKPPEIDGFQFPFDGDPPQTCEFGILGSCAYPDQYHLAEDYRLPVNEPVYACANGIVREAQFHNGYGGTVLIEHKLPSGEHVVSLYGHLFFSSLQVSAGDIVTRGQLIGYIANSDNNGGYSPHLHFGIHKNSYSQTPVTTCDGEWSYHGYTYSECDLSNWYDPSDFIESHPALVGYYNQSPSWRTDRSSQAFVDAYNNYRRKGYPLGDSWDNGGGEYVHEWYGIWIQDFYGEDNGFVFPYSALILNNNGQVAHLLKEGFWDVYMNLNVNGKNGPQLLGSPASDEYPAQYRCWRQDFQKGYMWYEDGSKLGGNDTVEVYEYQNGNYVLVYTKVYDGCYFYAAGVGGSQPGDPYVSFLGASPDTLFAGEDWQIQFELKALNGPTINDTIRVYYSDPDGANQVLLQEWVDVNIDEGASQMFVTQSQPAPTVGTYDITVKIRRGDGSEDVLNTSDGAINPKQVYVEERNPGNGEIKTSLYYPPGEVVFIDSVYDFKADLLEVSGMSSVQIAELRLTLHDSSGNVLYDLNTWYNLSLNPDEYWMQFDNYTFSERGIFKIGLRYTKDGQNWIYPETFLYQSDNPGYPNPKKIIVEDTVNYTPTDPSGLLTQGQTNPTEVYDSIPRFSAIFHDPDYADSAKYFRLQVSTSDTSWNSPIWDSGKTLLDSVVAQGERCKEIPYDGPPLDMEGATYYWRIKFWDNSGAEGNWSQESAYFTTSSAVYITANSNFTDCLVSYWEFEESSGIRYDSYGRNDLEEHNTVTQGVGKQGSCGDFEKSNYEYLSINDDNQVGLDLRSSFSISAWVKIETSSSGEYFIVNRFRDMDATSKNYALSFKSENNGAGRYVLCYVGIDWYIWSYNWQVGTWYNVVFVNDLNIPSGRVRLYVNGVLIGEDERYSSNDLNFPVPFLIGATQTADGTIWGYWDGLIDEVGIWSRVLSAEEVSQLYNNGEGIPYSPQSSLSKSSLSPPEVKILGAPNKFALYPNFPNPFNPITTIKYDLPRDSRVNLSVYNVLGQRVVTLVNGWQKAGYKSISWDGKDEFGRQVPSGIYIYRLQADDFIQSKKMILLK